MLSIVCNECLLCLQVVDDRDDLVGAGSDFWPNKYPCPGCTRVLAARAEESLTASERTFRVVFLSAEELFAALNGLGLPDEQDCTKEIVEGLLREHPIRRVAGTTIRDTQRFCLEHLELWDGTRLFFGASPEGAIVYRVVRRPNYAERVRD